MKDDINEMMLSEPKIMKKLMQLEEKLDKQQALLQRQQTDLKKSRMFMWLNSYFIVSVFIYFFIISDKISF